MSATTADQLRRQGPAVALAAGAAILAALVLFGADKPMMALALPVGVVTMWFVAQRPAVATVVVVVIEVTNISGVLANAHLPLFQASMLLGVVTLALALRDAGARARLNGWTVIAAMLFGCYLLTQGMAAMNSSDFATSSEEIRRAALDCAFVMVLLVLVQVTGRVWLAVAAFVIPLAVLCTLIVVNEFVFGGTNSFGGFAGVTKASGQMVTTLRYGGPLPDSNFWGRHLVMALPLAGALLVRAWQAGRRRPAAGWLLAVAALLAGVYLTQSRGTFLAALVGAAVWALASGRAARRVGLAGLPVLVLLVLVVPGIGNRLSAAFEDVSRAGDASATVDPSLLGRLASQEMAVLMFEERPAFGFGPGTYAEHVSEFAGQVPTAVIPPSPDRQPIEAPHNLFLQVAAESGVVGLVGWSVMVLGFLGILVLRIVAEPRSRDRVLVAAVCAGIAAWSAASIALHLAYFRTFGIVFALVPGLAPAWPVPWPVLRRFLRGVAVTVLAAAAGLAAAWFVTFTHSFEAVTAEQRLTLAPVGEFDGFNAYALDIRTRREVLPTFATLLRDTKSPVTIVADPVRGSLTFTTTAANEMPARTALELSVLRARALLVESIGDDQYSLVALDDIQTFPTVRRTGYIPVVAVGVGVGAALVTGLVLARVWSRREELPGELTMERERVGS